MSARVADLGGLRLLRYPVSMRSLLAVALTLASVASSYADAPRPIDAVVRRNIERLPALASDEELGFTKDALVIEQHGWLIDMSAVGCSKGAVSARMYCNWGAPKPTHTVGKIVSFRDGDLGWFQAGFIQRQPTASVAMRAAGIVVGDGATWAIPALLYSAPAPDKDLAHRRRSPMPAEQPELAGDKKLAGVVAGWFKTGFAPHAGKPASLLASGSSPSEFSSGAGALRLAKRWDKLKLAARDVHATQLHGGKVAWVTATVLIPRKGKELGFELLLAAVLVPDGDGWRWVSLPYQSPQPDSMEEVMDDDDLSRLR